MKEGRSGIGVEKEAEWGIEEAVIVWWWRSVKGRKEGVGEIEGGEGIGKGGGRCKLGEKSNSALQDERRPRKAE
jgi:hypothetical protein